MTNTKSQSLEPKYKKNKYYAITIQPNDKIQYLGNPYKARILKVRSYYHQILKDYSIPYYINLEMSEPIGSLAQGTSGSRLHYHGIITFESTKHIQQFLLEIQYKLLRQSRLEISKINDPSSWLNYINKQNLIPFDIKNLTTGLPEVFIVNYKEHYLQ